jgi:uncharacterized integral membrane protein (TIGR00697 family)
MPSTMSLPDKPDAIAFVTLLTVHTALLIAATAAGTKLIALPGGLAASATVVTYILSFVLLDTIAELFGGQAARLVINLGLVAVVLSVIFIEIAIQLPPAPFWDKQQSFEAVFSSAPRILLGGWTAYLLGQYIDLAAFLGIKKTNFGANRLWLRALLAMLISQLIDTIAFITIAFGGTIPFLPTIIGQYLIKVAVAVIATPLVSFAVSITRYFTTKSPG